MSEQAPQPTEQGPAIVGFDGSPTGEDAVALALAASRVLGVATVVTVVTAATLDYAVRLARRTSASLRLYTVVADEAEVLPLLIARDAERAFSVTAHEAYRAALDRAIAGIPPGIEASGEILVGDVVDVLAELDTPDIDVLFCGSRGYGPIRRVLLGGVSSRLVRRARSPVVVVPRGP